MCKSDILKNTNNLIEKNRKKIHATSNQLKYITPKINTKIKQILSFSVNLKVLNAIV